MVSLIHSCISYRRKYTSNLVVGSLFPIANVYKVEQRLTLVEADHKTAQTRVAIHLPIPYTSMLKVLHICVGSDHDSGAVQVNVEGFGIRDDSIVELVRSFLATIFPLVQKLLMELDLKRESHRVE